jgi:hypothetical protein
MTPKRFSAPLDNHNVITDSLFDAIFDDCSWYEQGCCVLGFHDGLPYMLDYIFGSHVFTVTALGRLDDKYIHKLFELLDTETLICEGYVLHSGMGDVGTYKLYFRE